MLTVTNASVTAAEKNTPPALYEGAALEQALSFPQVYEQFREYRRASTVEELRARQRGTLRALLDHTMRMVPAYRGLAGTASADPFEQLQGLPLVTRSDLTDHLADHCADDIDPSRCRSIRTSGTTGIPLRLIVDQDDLVMRHAVALHRYKSYGLGLHRRILRPLRPAFDRWFEYTSPAAGLARVAEFGPSDDARYLAEVAERIRYFEPDVIFARPSRCLAVIRLLTERSVRLHVAAVVTLGENLTPAVRETVSEFFAAPLYDTYGMREVSDIAAQCSAGSYHVESDRLVVEVVDDNGRPVDNGVIGEIVVTNLLSRTMPLLRYRTGDAGALGASECSCGSTYPTLDRISGREHGKIVLGSDASIEAFRLTWILRGYALERFQVVQDDSLAVRILLRPAKGFSANDGAEIRHRAEQLLSCRVPVRVMADDEASFLSSASGKAVDFVGLPGKSRA